MLPVFILYVPVWWSATQLGGGSLDFKHWFRRTITALRASSSRCHVGCLPMTKRVKILSSATFRSGQQAALAADLLALLDALQIERAVLGGYDWGGRAARVVAALYPSRARGLVSGSGYNIQNIATSMRPASPEKEHRLWYQYYFHGERGRAGLMENRREFCRLLWSMWSPTWRFDGNTYARSAVAFDNLRPYESPRNGRTGPPHTVPTRGSSPTRVWQRHSPSDI